MTHSDDKGLILPPRLATTHLVIVPILSNASKRAAVLEASERLKKSIEDSARGKLPYTLGVLVDNDETKQPGWKFHEYELTGVPLRIEIGPRDLEKNQVVLVRRDLGKKEFLPIEEVVARVPEILKAMQDDLLQRALKFREENTHEISSYEDFKNSIEKPGGFFVAAWCGSSDCEEKVKNETKATIRCLPLDEKFQVIPMERPCFVCERQTSDVVRAIFARSY